MRSSEHPMRAHLTADGDNSPGLTGNRATELSRIFGGGDALPVHHTAHHAQAVSDEVGVLHLSSISGGPLHVRHPARPGSSHEGDQYLVTLQVAGDCVVEQDDVRNVLGPGDLTICDTSRPYSLTYDAGFRLVLLQLPRAALPVRPAAMRALTARRLGTERGVGALVGPFLRRLGEQRRTCTDTAALSMVDGAVSLLTALVTEQLARSAPSVRQPAVWLRLRTHIENRLGDPDLTPDSIAAAHGISRRYLFKLFADEGLTVAGWIRRRRLECCARELASPVSADQPIRAIAARWGLLDHRHFSRTFKAAYGETPREYRRRALAGADVRTDADREASAAGAARA